MYRHMPISMSTASSPAAALARILSLQTGLELAEIA